MFCCGGAHDAKLQPSSKPHALQLPHADIKSRALIVESLRVDAQLQVTRHK
jgi:hypothetical protein